MGEKIVIGPINKGLRTDRTAFTIDNDSFPTLVNTYQWRGRIKRKRGTSFLCRLQRFLGTTNGVGDLVITILPIPIGIGISTFTVGEDVFVDPGGASPVNLLTNSAGTGVLNRATGVLTITGSLSTTSVIYYPTLPVMGLEDLRLLPTQFPGTMAFDTVYSYIIQTQSPYLSYDVSFYKNPIVNPITLPGYIPKATPTKLNWNGENYQQFWTVNYQGALWATNGIDIGPTTLVNVGMQFKKITAPGVVAIVAGPPAFATITIIAHGLVIGDFVFINEVVGVTGINLQTGYVVNVIDVNTIRVQFPDATIGGAYASGGIVQYLTNTADTTLDSLRWYDGDPTDGNPTSPTFIQGNGWVNFAPPISQDLFSIGDLPAAQYYLVGARVIFPFKDRLIFFGVVVQSSGGTKVYLQDTIVYSQNGTPYYTSSYTNTPNAAIDTPASASNNFFPIIAPDNKTATSTAYIADITGFGGFLTAGVSQPIISVAPNRDVLIVGFSTLQTKLADTQSELDPFTFYNINSELGTGSTFSVVNLDQGVMATGIRGFTLTGQEGTQRIDLDIIDQVFQISFNNNGFERICAQRDFINEWIYFSYPQNEITYVFPNQTLQYNYRDNTWAVFNECYTTYGKFRETVGDTWATVGLPPSGYTSWLAWNDPWNAGVSELLTEKVIAGNQQGFVVMRDEGTSEQRSLYIQNINNNTISSPNHCLNAQDYIIINDVLGSVGAEVNGKIFSVSSPITDNSFNLNPPIGAGVYQGGGNITRMYVPFVQTKQFPAGWDVVKKTRLGPQQYLLTTTPRGQIQLLIFLSQNATSAYNNTVILPDTSSRNNSLLYSTVLFTCPESTNLGLTPANINLQMVTAESQQQIWHRKNTSLLGDTIQIGFSMSDEQMRSFVTTIQTSPITGATNAYPTVLDIVNVFNAGQMIQISEVVGMVELNGNIYQVMSTTSTQVTINVDSTAFEAYVSGGIATIMTMPNQFAEIELHSILLDVSPSMLLA